MKKFFTTIGVAAEGQDVSRVLLCCALVASLGVARTAWAQPFTILHVTQQQMHGLDRTHYVVQNGANPLNRFGVERVVLTRPLSQVVTTPVILEPALSASATLFTLGNTPDGGDFGRSIAATLAHGELDLFL